MENKSFDDAMQGSFTASMAERYSVATNHHAVARPSLPNYLALTPGPTWGITDDGYHRLPPEEVGHQLTEAGILWRAHMESVTGGRLSSRYPYAVRHDPFACYGGSCSTNAVPLTRLRSDLQGSTPRFTWITPNLSDDTHDCPLNVGDSWLRSTVPGITSSPAWQALGVLFIACDEAESSGDNHVATLVIAPHQLRHASARHYDHYSLLATVEDELGVPRPGRAAQATPMDDLLP
ncbi:MAG: alkaline phosphatase family protein [Candidatus Dormibacteraceae bacterium]